VGPQYDQRVKAFAIGKVEVQQDDRGGPAPEPLHRARESIDAIDQEAIRRGPEEHLLDEADIVGIVLDQQDGLRVLHREFSPRSME